MFNLLQNKHNLINNQSNIMDKKTNNAIKQWLRRNDLEGISIEELLSKLGFNLKENILLLEKQDNYIKLYIDNNYVLELTPQNIINIYNDNFQIKYYCVKDIDNKLKLYKELDTIKENENGIKYQRTLTTYGISINIIFLNDIEITFNCQGHFNFKKEQLNELKQYLLNLNFPVPIYEIFKHIKILYLPNENIYSKLELNIKKDNQIISSINYTKEDLHPIFTKHRIFTIKDYNKNIAYKRPINIDNNIFSAELINNDYRLEIYFNLEPSNNNSNNYNEISLRDYLLNLEFPITIEELYQNIKTISLKYDIDKYINIKIDLYHQNNLISTLHLFYGNVTSYKKSKFTNNKVKKLTK